MEKIITPEEMASRLTVLEATLNIKIKQLVRNEFESLRISALEETRLYVEQLFNDEVFQKRINDFILRNSEQEIRARLSKKGINKILGKQIKGILRDDMPELIKEIIAATLSRVNQKLKIEADVCKSLTYSIDSEIRHTLMRMDVSYESSKMIEKETRRVIDEIGQKVFDRINTKKILIG